MDTSEMRCTRRCEQLPIQYILTVSQFGVCSRYPWNEKRCSPLFTTTNMFWHVLTCFDPFSQSINTTARLRHFTIARCQKHPQAAFLARLCRMSKVNALPLKIQGSEKICIGGDRNNQSRSICFKEHFVQPHSDSVMVTPPDALAPALKDQRLT